MARTIVCPSCGARLDEGAEFDHIEFGISAFNIGIESINEDGEIVVGGGGNESFERTLATKDIICMTCQHQWHTKRKVAR